MKKSIEEFQKLMARLLEFSLPSLAVFNGKAIAGGYILGLCHDNRIMHESIGEICLSELKLGLPLPPPYMRVCAAKLTSIICNKLAYSVTCKQQEALEDNLIDDTYKDDADK